MFNQNKSLIQKFATNQLTLSPLEAIHLKHLSDQKELDKLFETEQIINPYEENKSSTRFAIEIILNRAKVDDPKSYWSYQKAYKKLFILDRSFSARGYEGIALLIQFRLMMFEFFNNYAIGIEEVKDAEIFYQQLEKNSVELSKEFVYYSPIHQKEVGFSDILLSLTNVLGRLLIGLNNVLVLNFYLKKMIDVKNLECLKLFRMLFVKDKDIKKIYDDKFIPNTIKSNHSMFVDSMFEGVKNIPLNFENNSLQYVMDTISSSD